MTLSNGAPMPNTTTFIKQLLEPRPAEELVDTHHNLILRQVRWHAWRKADAKTRYLRAQSALKTAEMIYRFHFGGAEQDDDDRRKETVVTWRQAVAEQILLPAPDKAAIRWKRIEAKDKFLPITAAQIARAIADDEAWLAAHPVKCSLARRSMEAANG